MEKALKLKTPEPMFRVHAEAISQGAAEGPQNENLDFLSGSLHSRRRGSIGSAAAFRFEAELTQRANACFELRGNARPGRHQRAEPSAGRCRRARLRRGQSADRRSIEPLKRALSNPERASARSRRPRTRRVPQARVTGDAKYRGPEMKMLWSPRTPWRVSACTRGRRRFHISSRSPRGAA